MNINPDIAASVSLLSEPSRAAILMALMDGRFHTATELAYMAAIKPQTASFHLAKLNEGNLVKVEKHGRHRYYSLANSEIAGILESLLAISRPPEIRSLNQSTQTKALREARTCYDHLAGNLGVRLTTNMVKAGYLEKKGMAYQVTAEGERFFTAFGLDLQAIRKRRRAFSRACLDWSERHHHLAGALGEAIAGRLFDLEWIARVPTSRAVKITEAGRRGFAKHFGLQLK